MSVSSSCGLDCCCSESSRICNSMRFGCRATLNRAILPDLAGIRPGVQVERQKKSSLYTCCVHACQFGMYADLNEVSGSPLNMSANTRCRQIRTECTAGSSVMVKWHSIAESPSEIYRLTDNVLNDCCIATEKYIVSIFALLVHMQSLATNIPHPHPLTMLSMMF